MREKYSPIYIFDVVDSAVPLRIEVGQWDAYEGEEWVEGRGWQVWVDAVVPEFRLGNGRFSEFVDVLSFIDKFRTMSSLSLRWGETEI